MPWVWTDDLAVRLADAGIVDSERLADWRQWPMALHVPDAADGDEESP